jgi:hypothetical protein
MNPDFGVIHLDVVDYASRFSDTFDEAAEFGWRLSVRISTGRLWLPRRTARLHGWKNYVPVKRARASRS